MKTITITPNYKNLFNQFLQEAENSLYSLALPRTHTLGTVEVYTRKEVYDFIASFRIALGAMSDTDDLETLRGSFDKGAEAMFTQLNKEQEEGFNSKTICLKRRTP